MKALIVDDNHKDLYLAKMLLIKGGYEVITATNGTEALSLIKGQKLDVIISDIFMPVMDGYQLCTAVKENEQLKDTPFIFYSATYIEKKDKELALKLGADKFIQKPVIPEAFMKTINSAVKSTEQSKLVDQTPILRKEKEILKLYNKVLVNKLEQKVFDLEREISQHKLTALALKESIAKYRSLVSNIPDVTWTSNSKEQLIYVSPNVKKIYGYSPEELYQNSNALWFGRIHPEDNQRVRKAYKKLFENGTKYDVWYRVNRKDGAWIWLHDRAISVYEKNGVMMADGIFSDITKQKLAQEALKEREKKYRTIFEHSNDGIFLHDLNGTLLASNKKAQEMLGYSKRELNGSPLSRLYDESRLDASKKAALENNGKGERTFEFKFTKRDGALIDVEISSSVVDRKKGHVQWIVRDVSERKRMEVRLQQAQKLESIGNLASGIAHDFNNILFTIIGMAELLSEEFAVNSQEYENVMEILKAGKRGSELVAQILTFSRQSERKMAPVRLQHILKEVLKLSRSTIPSNIQVIDRLQSDCGTVMADPTQMHQIAMNLIANALHAVEPTYGKISIGLKETTIDANDLPISLLAPGRYAQLTVSDTGCGIAPDIMEKIFEPYFTTKKSGKGTGLGLSVVYGIVKKHKGDIKVYSEVDVGTTFNVYLPLMEKSFERDSVEAVGKNQTGQERILLVDDEAPIARLEREMLKRLGYKVTSFLNSLDALEAFRTSPDDFDLVITDMTMPHMTGDELARELILIKPQIPIIICTGFSEWMNAQVAKEIGIKGFLMKPILKSEMASLVRKVLDELYVVHV